MNIGIMQPYFLPYIGYIQLIQETDHFVLLDTVQYIRHGWINRNRILKPNGTEDQYIKVPLKKHKRGTVIKDIEITENEEWKKRILAQIEHYKKKAPHYFKVRSFLEESFSFSTNNITHQNAHLLKCVFDYLEMEFNYSIFSEMDLSIEPVTHAGEWALNIAKAMKADAYTNPVGGVEIFKQEQFEQANIDLRFLQSNLTNYYGENFLPGLSILDVMMFCDKKEIIKLINNREISVK